MNLGERRSVRGMDGFGSVSGHDVGMSGLVGVRSVKNLGEARKARVKEGFEPRTNSSSQ